MPTLAWACLLRVDPCTPTPFDALTEIKRGHGALYRWLLLVFRLGYHFIGDDNLFLVRHRVN